MRFSVITLFPELIEAWSRTGLVGTAIKKNLLSVETIQLRDFAIDVHRSVDDTAYGGSDGMVLKFEPLSRAIETAKRESTTVVFLTPQGRPWDQTQAKQWQTQASDVLLVCGRYAGFDHRLIEEYADLEISVGDFILNGGEVAALTVMESVSRLIPGVLGNAVSVARESFANGLLEPPVFTRPREVNGLPVPSPLISGDHAQTERFERDIALLRTKSMRPDLIRQAVLENECVEARSRVLRLSKAELKSLGMEDL